MVQLVVGYKGEEIGVMVLRQKKLLTGSYSAVWMVVFNILNAHLQHCIGGACSSLPWCPSRSTLCGGWAAYRFTSGWGEKLRETGLSVHWRAINADF